MAKSFGHDVSNHVRSLDIPDGSLSVCYEVITDMVMLLLDVLCAHMELRVLAEYDGSLVVTSEFCGILLGLAYLLKEDLEPLEVLASCAESNVL